MAISEKAKAARAAMRQAAKAAERAAADTKPVRYIAGVGDQRMKMDEITASGITHSHTLIDMLADAAGYSVLLILGVIDNQATGEILLLDAPAGELVDVNFGYEGVDVHFVRSGTVAQIQAAGLGNAVVADEVYVLETDLDHNRAHIVEKGFMIGAAALPEHIKDPARAAYIARRKR